MPWSEAAPAAVGALAVAAVAWAGARWAIVHAHARGLLDLPDARRSHAVPTPRGGGIGIALGLFGALLLQAVRAPDALPWGLLAAGLALVALAGGWDDHRPLPAWPRLLVHAAAALLLAFALHRLGGGLLLAVLAAGLALGLVNAWNFMDGIDGLAASQALLCGLAYALLAPAAAGAGGLALAAACAGFLPWNLPRARVFLGDVGSGSLGYAVALLIGLAALALPPAQWPWLLLPPLAMLADSGLTLADRIRRGERWWQPHVQHAYQCWSRRRGHLAVTLAYAGWTALAGAVMLYGAARLPAQAAWQVPAAAALLAGGLWGWLRRGFGEGRTA